MEEMTTCDRITVNSQRYTEGTDGMENWQILYSEQVMKFTWHTKLTTKVAENLTLFGLNCALFSSYCVNVFPTQYKLSQMYQYVFNCTENTYISFWVLRKTGIKKRKTHIHMHTHTPSTYNNILWEMTHVSRLCSCYSPREDSNCVPDVHKSCSPREAERERSRSSLLLLQTYNCQKWTSTGCDRMCMFAQVQCTSFLSTQLYAEVGYVQYSERTVCRSFSNVFTITFL